MVVAIDRVSETVAVIPTPSLQQVSVYSSLQYSDHRRHKEEVNFRSVLHPIRYSDTAIVYINNTRKRFVSRTFYQPRVRPQSFAETAYNNPKTADLLFVTYLDHNVDENRKWFKTCVEIKAKKFTSAQLLRSQNNNYINTSLAVSSESDTLSSLYLNGSVLDNDLSLDNASRGQGQVTRPFKDKYDPGASQVFIPKRRHHSSDKSLVNGDIILKFPNSKVDLNYNNHLDDFSDV